MFLNYDEDFGLCYEQKVVEAKIDKERYEKNKKAAMQSTLFLKLAKFFYCLIKRRSKLNLIQFFIKV